MNSHRSRHKSLHEQAPISTSDMQISIQLLGVAIIAYLFKYRPLNIEHNALFDFSLLLFSNARGTSGLRFKRTGCLPDVDHHESAEAFRCGQHLGATMYSNSLAYLVHMTCAWCVWFARHFCLGPLSASGSEQNEKNRPQHYTTNLCLLISFYRSLFACVSCALV